MTAHPFILPSAVLSKSLHNLPSAIPCVFSIHLFSLPFSVGADPCVCLITVHFKLSGGHMGPPLQKMKALSKKLKSWKKFHK